VGGTRSGQLFCPGGTPGWPSQAGPSGCRMGAPSGIRPGVLPWCEPASSPGCRRPSAQFCSAPARNSRRSSAAGACGLGFRSQARELFLLRLREPGRPRVLRQLRHRPGAVLPELRIREPSGIQVLRQVRRGACRGGSGASAGAPHPELVCLRPLQGEAPARRRRQEARLPRARRAARPRRRPGLDQDRGPRRGRPHPRAPRGPGDGAPRRSPAHRHRLRHRREGQPALQTSKRGSMSTRRSRSPPSSATPSSTPTRAAWYTGT